MANLLTCAGARQHPAVSIGFCRHRRWKETTAQLLCLLFPFSTGNLPLPPGGQVLCTPKCWNSHTKPIWRFYILKCRACKSEIRVGMWLSSDELSMHTTTQTRNPTGTQSVPTSPALGQLSILDHTVRACLKNTKLRLPQMWYPC